MSTAKRHDLDFLIRFGCRTKPSSSRLTRILSLSLRSQDFWRTHRRTVGYRSEHQAPLVRRCQKTWRTLRAKQLEVAVQREHPEAVRRLSFGCVNYVPLWSTSEAEHPQTFRCTVSVTLNSLHGRTDKEGNYFHLCVEWKDETPTCT